VGFSIIPAPTRCEALVLEALVARHLAPEPLRRLKPIGLPLARKLDLDRYQTLEFALVDVELRSHRAEVDQVAALGHPTAFGERPE
jgi:hypothetical protein